MPSANIEMLIQILAATDVLFLPFRYQSISHGRVGVAINERRVEFRKLGLQFVGGGGGAKRQEHSRALAAARREGLVTVAGGPTPRVKLTESASRALRAVLALPQIENSWGLLETIAALTDARIVNGGHVPEYGVLGRGPCEQQASRDLVGLEYSLTPLLVEGWLESCSDSQGHVGYAITKAGRVALKLGLGTAVSECDLPEFDQAAADQYDAFFKSELAARNSWVPASTQEVHVPLSCGLWPDVPKRFRRDKPAATGTSAAEGMDG